MGSIDTVAQHFEDAAETIAANARVLAPHVATAGDLLIDALRAGGKIMLCGNGGSAADAQHFAAELVNRFETDRPGLAAIALTADTSTLTSIANDSHFQRVFAREVEALGRPSNVLILITTSGNSPSLIRAAAAAREREIRCVALNGRDAGALSAGLLDRDVDLLVRARSTARIQEVHGVIIHCLCTLIDHSLSE